MKRTEHKTELGHFIDGLILTGAIALVALLIALTGCVSQRKYNTLKKENERLKSQINNTESYYKELLLDAQRNDKNLWK